MTKEILLDSAEKIKPINRVHRKHVYFDDKILQMQKELHELHSLINWQFKELNYADLLHDTIINSTWLKDKSFSLHGWAANYSFIYMLYRILDNVKPHNILEMGMGQTSRVTSQYVAYCNPNSVLDIIENDADWIKNYESQLAHNENIKIHKCDLELFTYENTECRKYKDLNAVVGNKKYDLIIVDGPFGSGQPFPRSNVLDMIKNGNIASDFIIILDDTERPGEQNIIAEIKKLFNNQNIEYKIFQRNGIKAQTYVTSVSKSFVQFL